MIETATDACTLNNVLNVVQLACLIALLKWIRSGDRRGPADL